MEHVNSLNGDENFPPRKSFDEPPQSGIGTEILNGKGYGDTAGGNNTRPPRSELPNLRYAGFWMRFWAYLLDIIIIGSINRLLVEPIFMIFDWSLYETSMFAPIAIVNAVVFYVYFVLMTKLFGQTLGKMVLGLRVIDLKGKKLTWSTVLIREWVGRFISTTIWITYAIVSFTPKKQGLHDLFADTTVIHESR